MDCVHKFVSGKLVITRSQIRKYYNQKQSEVSNWKADGKVWLDCRHTESKLSSKKLAKKRYGPFWLIEMIRTNCSFPIPEDISMSSMSLS